MLEPIEKSIILEHAYPDSTEPLDMTKYESPVDLETRIDNLWRVYYNGLYAMTSTVERDKRA